MKHCLIVDDSDIVRKFTRLIFESLNFRVSEADGSVEAIERLQFESPDYILIDWRMPGVNSPQLISKIRTLNLPRRPHIMYVTTENDAQDIKRAIAHGANSFILKPFNREIMTLKLQEIRETASAA